MGERREMVPLLEKFDGWGLPPPLTINPYNNTSNTREPRSPDRLAHYVTSMYVC